MSGQFGRHKAASNPSRSDSIQFLFAFPNGFGASVVQGPYTYGGKDGLWELGVLDGGKLTYETPLTDDVLGYLTADEVGGHLDAIEALPAKADSEAQR